MVADDFLLYLSNCVLSQSQRGRCCYLTVWNQSGCCLALGRSEHILLYARIPVCRSIIIMLLFKTYLPLNAWSVNMYGDLVSLHSHLSEFEDYHQAPALWSWGVYLFLKCHASEEIPTFLSVYLESLPLIWICRALHTMIMVINRNAYNFSSISV